MFVLFILYLLSNVSVKTNIGKKFFNLDRLHFPKNNKLHKIFNSNTIKSRIADCLI